MDAAGELARAVRDQAEAQRRLTRGAAPALSKRDLAAFVRLQRARDAAAPQADRRQARLRELVKGREPLSDAALIELIAALDRFETWSFTSFDWIPVVGIARRIRRSLEGCEPPRAVVDALAELAHRRLAEGGPAESRRAAAILLEAVPGGAPDDGAVVALLDQDDDWGAAAAAAIGARGAETAAWRGVLVHAASASQSTPSKRWLAAARQQVDALGEPAFGELAACLLGALEAPPSGELRRGAGIGAFAGLDQLPRAVPTERNATLLRGLVWSCSLPGGAAMARLVADAARACQRKLPDVGARSPKVLNACLWSLAAMPDEAGAPHLVELQERTRKPAARARVAAALSQAAAAAGIPRVVIEDRAVPTYGLESGPLVLRAGRATCEVTIEPPGRICQRWRGATGAPLARAPRALPRELRDLRATLSAQRARFERLLATRAAWPWGRFRDGVLAHPVAGAIAGSLIVDGDTGAWLPAHDPAPALGDGAEVRLWHPAGRSLDEVLGWRERLQRLRVTQPFKQAHREVYLLTPAERTAGVASPRFAGFVVRQHALAALAAQRGWRCRLQGPFDPGGDPYPTLELPEAGLVATLEADPIEDPALQSGHIIFLYLRTGAVRFRRGAAAVPLEAVPPVVLSEVLRDVDLFVSVAGIGADPAWPQGASPDWAARWREQAFGELSPLAERRRETLERVLPGLPFGDRARLDGRFLVVRGARAEYRIHLGSGGVVREPGSRALCIVTGGGGALPGEPGHVWLPFEGDPTLAAILSKAFLLWRDDEVTDPAIRAQLDAG